MTPFTYRSVAPGLFGRIMLAEMQSDDADVPQLSDINEGRNK